MTHSMVDPAFDLQFRKAMRRLASSVCVISSAREQKKYAMTATAVCSFSAEPPSLLICINKYSRLHTLLSQKLPFCVNILHNTQQDIAIRCSASADDAADDETYLPTQPWGLLDNIPYLTEAQANIFCQYADSLSYSTHTAFIGQMLTIKYSDKIAPLIYLDGQYRQL